MRTIFACEYLASEELRREINSGLQVVESWNSGNGLIFYGKDAALAGPDREHAWPCTYCNPRWSTSRPCCYKPFSKTRRSGN